MSIDYGLGTTNIDKKTGIRYGVISQHSVNQDALNDLEPDYGQPTCPECGNEVKAPTNRQLNAKSYKSNNTWSCADADFACKSCKLLLDSSEVYPEESQGFTYSQDGYELTDCLDSDIFVLKSPYYTHGSYCSPCVPGAINLESDNPNGARGYCLGHDWFDGGKAPYPVFSVESGKQIVVKENKVTCPSCHGTCRIQFDDMSKEIFPTGIKSRFYGMTSEDIRASLMQEYNNNQNSRQLEVFSDSVTCWRCYDYGTKAPNGYLIEQVQEEIDS